VDFAVWQRNCYEQGFFNRQIEYWKNKLGGKLPELALPTDFPRTAIETFEGHTHTRILSPGFVQKLNDFARENDLTLYMIMLAAFNILLHRYCRQDDIIVATSIAGRNKFELEHLIGFFVNTLPLRSDLSGDPSFEEFLNSTKTVCLQAFANQDAPFEKIVEAIQPERTLSKQSLFQVLLVMHNAASPDLIMPDLEVESLRVHNNTAKFDLLFHIREEPQGLRLGMEYSTELFKEDTIERLLEHFENLLVSGLADKKKCISKLSIIGSAERKKLLKDFNKTKKGFEFQGLISERFEQQVDKMPDAVAVIFNDEFLTYKDLEEKSNRLANHLKTFGVMPESRIGICLKRSADMICAVLAVLKCGSAYVPLDSTYPNDRLTYILQDSKVHLLITQEALLPNLPDKLPELIILEKVNKKIEKFSDARIKSPGSLDNLAYITYTSGSTGKPKGIGMVQSSLLNLLDWMITNTKLPPQATTLQFASLSFDVSFQDIFSTLLSGGTLHIITEEERQDIHRLAKIITAEKVNRIFIPAVALQQLAEGFNTSVESENVLKKVIAGSEQLHITPKIVEMFSKLPEAHLHNEYGPSEAHVVTELELKGTPITWEKRPNVGKPISNTSIYILDNHLEPTPTCVPGELYISGFGLARGYLTLPGLTAEKFIPDPFSDKLGARMYRTGDMARFLADGNIEFLGRADFQIKIRGFRIEPGEIEVILSEHKNISEAVVTAFTASDFDKRLIAYLVGKGKKQPTPQDLRRFLKEKLPEYMIPSAFVFLEKIPLHTNGKVDRNNLPIPDFSTSISNKDFVAPSSQTEILVSEIWQNIIGLEKIGMNDNFFEIGGHSLLAMRLISQVADSFQIDFPLRLIFEFPTLSQFCSQLKVYETEPGVFETTAELINQLNEMSEEDALKLLESQASVFLKRSVQ
jgi:amino acid adenylation domain-containing protein